MNRPAIVLLAAALAARCAPAPEEPPTPPTPPPVAAESGTPKLGPGDLYNACERIWCLTHEANFDLKHFLSGHDGWVVHDDAHGDVFLPRFRQSGPPLPGAREAALNLCGSHVHPWFLAGRRGPIKRTGWNAGLGYDRRHFAAYGARLDPCCPNGLGWGFIHAASPRQFRLHDTATWREFSAAGWQAPLARAGS